MNERMTELYEQAHDVEKNTLYFIASCLPPDIPQQFSREDEVRTFNPKKFAELIVKECAELATKEYDARGAIHGNDLLKHFGIEQ